MNPDEFRNSPAGFLTPTERDQLAFVPHPLPPKGVRYDVVMFRLASASTLVGRLSGAGRRFANPFLLVRPLQHKEAVSSSAIEGTHTTLSELLQMEAREDERNRSPDTREVRNYVQSLEFATAQLGELPIGTRLIKGAHARLLADVSPGRGGHTTPGEFKRAQNYIGGSSLESARFVPAPHMETERLMSDLERFVHSGDGQAFPPLVLAALVHYQFETIHPFPDGNGRVGRLLIPLILQDRGMLETPLLYLSPFLERNQDEYIERLFHVSKAGDWVGWIDFFLRGVEETCEKTIAAVETLHDLNISYLDTVQKAQSSALLRGLINRLFEIPLISIPQAASLLGVTYSAAKRNIERLVDAGILEDMNFEARPKVFLASGIFEVLNGI